MSVGVHLSLPWISSTSLASCLASPSQWHEEVWRRDAQAWTMSAHGVQTSGKLTRAIDGWFLRMARCNAFLAWKCLDLVGLAREMRRIGELFSISLTRESLWTFLKLDELSIVVRSIQIARLITRLWTSHVHVSLSCWHHNIKIFHPLHPYSHFSRKSSIVHVFLSIKLYTQQVDRKAVWKHDKLTLRWKSKIARRSERPRDRVVTFKFVFIIDEASY